MVRTILVVGAGKSTSYLIDYFLERSNEENIHLKIGDIHPENIPDKFTQHPNCTVFSLDIFNEAERKKLFPKPPSWFLCYLHVCTSM